MTTSAIEDFAASVGAERGLDLAGYEALWQWSIERPEQFWRDLWNRYALTPSGGTALGESDEHVLADPVMPGARWFPGVSLNYVDQILRHTGLPGAAIIGLTEDGGRTEIAWSELASQVAGVAATLREFGVGRGDRVVAYLPHVPEAVIAFLATASLGAVFSGCGQDYAPEGAAGRLAQLRPKVLVWADGYRYGGKWIDKRSDSAELAALLPTLAGQLVVRIGDQQAQPSGDRPSGGELSAAAIEFTAAAGRQADLITEPVPFDHPLWVLFSSGTTGKPKGIMHGHGGVLLEHLKAVGLQGDMDSGDVFFWQTALSWMMWNYQVAGLLVGARIVCYSGHPLYPDADRLWQVVESEKVSYFGTSPGQLQASRKANLNPGSDHELGALRTIGSTGSTLAADLFVWIDEHVRQGIPVSSISGGTDVVTAFAGGSPGIAVVAGELSVRYLGVELESWSPDCTPLVGEVGEMVITTAMPSMPVGFWDDPDGERYRAAYFDHEWSDGPRPHVWRHGDWVTLTERGSIVIHGRSDATLNRNGIRMGSADIYEVVEGIDQVSEGFVLGVDGPGGAYWMPLFVTLTPGSNLDDALIAQIRSEIRARLSPRHVPDEVIVAPGIPHTRTGKKLEVPVTAILAGRSDVAVDPRSVDDPDLLGWFRERGAEHSWI
ncbi:acetoacetate--CoA ligase [Williamsia sp. 1135]|uniref:acetoacetate--CoA ligase n=1 Tax=Williamsia sp. 1135 TaxID=1889262 RepID=UPI000A11B33C|nr:acetoacetate--CoA ligase [Williamsia sp. 1135]ORM30198.1 acetoacetate--CoA ligase [Williamsia sp. 1135]